MEERLDKLLIQRGLVSTRVRAELIIRDVGVMVNGKLITKTGKRFPVDCSIEMIEEEIPWVSRGAFKLLEALKRWDISVKDKVFMDVGASTGGFTEVLLANDAKKIYCIDVGQKQLHRKIAEDSRVVNLEKTHVRELTPALIPESIQGCVIDVSFISLTKVFPFIHTFIEPGASIMALVKPQFEVGKDNVRKGGIVKDKNLYPKVIETIKQSGAQVGFEYQAHCDSPILGGDGNREFLMWFIKG